MGLTMQILVEIAPGELIDKITILEIKLEQIKDSGKLANIQREYQILNEVRKSQIKETAELTYLMAELKRINTALWIIEDDIRDLERAKNFGPEFIELARSVYRTNDERAAVKRAINDLLNSAIIEEKSYAAY
jgi:hypothetical protein